MKNGRAPKAEREYFSSQFGLIMVAVGSAVGLGNIWRFSYILGINGGGAFLLVYLLCVLLLGLPVLIAEFSIGRSGGLGVVGSFRKLAPGSAWWLVGAVGVLSVTVILCYYPVVAGWALGYVFESIFNWPALAAGSGAAFADFTASGKDLFFSCLTLLLTALVLAGGVTAGIERWNKVLMPALGAILLLLALRSLTLPGALAGVSFMFYPDFSKLGVMGIVDALGHSFYSLSLGGGAMITYASYMKKDADLVSAVVSIVSMDTLMALLAGLAIFPAVFALGLNPGQGANLAFITLPYAFAQTPGGQLCSALFFLLLFVAALTTIMSLMQVVLAFLEDEFKLSRRKSLVLICSLLIVCGLPAVLSFGPLADWKILGLNYFSLLDRVATDILLPVAGLLGTLFVIFRLGTAASQREFVTGAKKPGAFVVRLYPVAVKYIAPPAIALILLNGLFNL